MHKLGKTTPRNRRALHECEQVECFGDQLRMCRHARFFDETEKTEQGPRSAVGMQRGDPAGLPVVPRFQECEPLFPATLAYDDPVWSESHGRASEPSHIR